MVQCGFRISRLVSDSAVRFVHHGWFLIHPFLLLILRFWLPISPPTVTLRPPYENSFALYLANMLSQRISFFFGIYQA